MSYLVIMESPSKAATVKSYLGSSYKVIASKGHIRDLPKSTFGVDIDNNFEAHYINIRGKGDTIKEIRREAKNATKVFLATDPDREGEAIAWHLSMALGIPVEKTQRITFNEVTKNAVKAAIKDPRQVDMNLVDAQQTRRILDRIVGYKLTPLLWKNVRNGLSAGRVQSVATKIIVEREEEIRAFKPSEYWTVDAVLAVGSDGSVTVHYWGNADGKQKLENEAQAKAIVNDVENGEFTVSSVKRSVRHKQPAPPFTTSTLQQEASRKYNFQSARVMRVAQELYEGVNLGAELGGSHGLITYMRTDSLRISEEAQSAAKEFIVGKYGEQFYPETARQYKAKQGAQDAHEAIRPVRADLEPSTVRKYLTSDQYKLYKLIWDRFIASQMQSAALSVLNVEASCKGHIFKAGGYTVTFPGYMVLYRESGDESENRDDPDGESEIRLPDLNEGQKLHCAGVDPEKHFTEPPARYNEASLIKFLEEKGIGRPSTYSTIITTIIQRNYVARDGKSFVPTQLGEVTNKLMNENFGSIIDYKFTADIENELDGIENGTDSMNQVLKAFWDEFEQQLVAAEAKLGDGGIEIPPEETDIICDKCGAKMVVKSGKFGKFAACPNYPRCRNTKPLTENAPEAEEKKPEKKAEPTGVFCDKCGAEMVLRTGRYGSFYACPKYPACKSIKPKVKSIDVPCPKCGAQIIMKNGKNKTVFYSCERYPECDFSSWDMPTDEKCPSCGGMLFRKKGKPVLTCADKNCGYTKEVPSTEPDNGGENQ